MLKRAFILAISTILLTNCTWHNINTNKKNPPTMLIPTVISENTSEFTKIKINGKIDVNIHTGSNIHKVVFYGAQQDIVSADHGVKYGELFINLDKKAPKYGYMKVDIYMRKLTSFRYNGSGNILATGIKSSCVDVDINNNGNTTLGGSFGLGRAKFSNSGYYKIQGVHGCATNLILMDNAKVNLNGYSNVANLNMGDNSQLNLYWVKSKTIHIKLKDNSRAQLSGVAETFDSEQWDKSLLETRHLMAQNSFVKTHDTSAAYISVVKNQHTLAKDKSNIYFYFLPETQTDFMAKDGSVLDMREWHLGILN